MGEANHFVGDVDAVDFVEVAAQRTHETAGAAADFEGGVAGAKPLELDSRPRTTSAAVAKNSSSS